MNIEQRVVQHFDWVWFFALILLSGTGLIAAWSMTNTGGWDSFLGRHFIFLGLGIIVFLSLLYFDYHLYADFIAVGYLLCLAVLVAVLVAGRAVHNNKSWLYFGSLGFQPSEFAKVLVIVALAKYYSGVDGDRLGLRELLVGGLIVFVPTMLVVLQGDLGTAMTFVPIYAALTLMAGLRRGHLLIFALAGVLAAPLGWMMLHDYQRSRIQTVFNPSIDPLHRGYQTIQSKIAVGSGKFLGRGFKQGSQGQLGFLPARRTDFVFAVISEERGFLGSMIVLGLILLIAVKLLRAAKEAKDRLGTMVIIGVLALFLFHAFINIGMVVGLLPIAGIPLPFVSAGGSAMVSFFAAMSLCVNVKLRRFVN
ncbi:MAG: rod shape-determining protein RodA [Acidobacteria bacterium]|nr:rod shape-determining protein RodA [Acidobacteriota bacterium]